VRHALGVTLSLEITYNLPVSYRRGIRNSAGGVQSPPLSRWFSTGKPLLFKATGDSRCGWERNFVLHGYNNMAIHGFLEESSGQITIFGLYNYYAKSDTCMSQALARVAGVVHSTIHKIPPTLGREFHIAERNGGYVLTEREDEIIYWVSKGKTNNTIACILGISQNTVRNHIYNASTKLSASNRSALVSFAMDRFSG
ncbi:MAG: helix-turn-helix transcriptional regulator, partial [Pseudomonadota bacterium]|nr:helix-turn-helix transcriptional regulator [Pseudomonadota bacterium]